MSNNHINACFYLNKIFNDLEIFCNNPHLIENLIMKTFKNNSLKSEFGHVQTKQSKFGQSVTSQQVGCLSDQSVPLMPVVVLALVIKKIEKNIEKTSKKII